MLLKSDCQVTDIVHGVWWVGVFAQKLDWDVSDWNWLTSSETVYSQSSEKKSVLQYHMFDVHDVHDVHDDVIKHNIKTYQ